MTEFIQDTRRFFILYKPKDIVSGDFYWALAHTVNITQPNQEIFYIATADCTGHGVPGAFMSMLNISYLTETIIEKKIHKPAEILDSIRSEVISALNPEGSEEESKDGMDCVLSAFDFKNKKLHFAAANNPLWILREGKIIEYTADKMPVGKYHEEAGSFTSHCIDLKKGDIVYTFTDGYADQFGGPKGKKFKYKQLETILIENAHLPMDQQKETLGKLFDDWRGDLEQVDDVLLIGVKIF